MRKTIEQLWHRVMKSALKFGVIGLIGFGIDVGIFNLLRLGVFGDEHFFQGPIGAKIVSVALSTLATWFGNRFWTFREQRRQNFMMELLEFSVIAVLGMGISLGCLYVSHYVLGYQTLLADNISSNLIGLVLATAFRFFLYRFWVYGHHRSDSLSARSAASNEGRSNVELRLIEGSEPQKRIPAQATDSASRATSSREMSRRSA